MGRLHAKGKAGAVKNYITRSAAVKKLQCSLADFRRLCILKGIFPREPRSKKKANKGSSAPTSFYYTKDIAFLAHEPILKKLREHKSFAKKLSRALGRGEWGNAKSLEENKPIYRLDHIITERYPTFIDAVRDIDDALCMIFLFSSLPSNSRLPPELVENCARLSFEWQLYVMRSRCLRKVFLSIKGVYYQADIMDQSVTWLVPYPFTQNVPADVDIRVMLTFLELYQTLLGFVLFKLYTDAELAYPPPLDAKKDADGAGINALSVRDKALQLPNQPGKVMLPNGPQVTGKVVRQTIKTIIFDQPVEEQSSNSAIDIPIIEEDFVLHGSSSDKTTWAVLPTLSTLPQSLSTDLFSSYSFFLSRETPRSIFEFIVRSFGGQIGWPSSSGSGSPFDELDRCITHVIVDRPVVVETDESMERRELRSRRKYIQPQWIVDCINAGKPLLEDPYLQGKILPPHLSPFGEIEGSYIPGDALATDIENVKEGQSDAVKGDEDAESLLSRRAAELKAEATGVQYGAFEATFKTAIEKEGKNSSKRREQDPEGDMNKMMMSNKQRKLYEKVKYSQQKRESTRSKLENRKKELARRNERELT